MTGGRIPSDARAYLQAAERAANAYDAQACAAVYANDARLTAITDGASESIRGAGEIARAWRVYTHVLRRIGLQLRKRLVSATDDVIVNAWTGASRDGSAARGFEEWRFDADARVVEHSMWSSLSVVEPTGFSLVVRSLVGQPRAAFAFARARFIEARSR
jgi:hypothetical protein